MLQKMMKAKHQFTDKYKNCTLVMDTKLYKCDKPLTR